MRLSDVAKAGGVSEMKNGADCLVAGELPAGGLAMAAQLQIQTELWGMIQPTHGTVRNAVQLVVGAKWEENRQHLLIKQLRLSTEL